MNLPVSQATHGTTARRILMVDFVDALGRVSKTDNQLHNLLQKKYEVLVVDAPEVIFFTHYGHRNRLYSCKKIYYSQERYPPDWKQCDAAITSCFTDHTRAYYFPFFAAYRDGNLLVRQPGTDWDRVLDEKRDFCSFLNKYVDRTVRKRTEFFRELNRRKRVHAGGPALNNLGCVIADGEAAKMEFLAGFRFHIAFENRLWPGWTTEKFFDPFRVYSIPIYWGDTYALKYFNPKSFVNVMDFRDFRECCDYVMHLENDREAYAKMLMESPYLDNQVPEVFDQDRLLEFLVKEIERPEVPVARRRWFWPHTKWRLVKRDRIHGE
jgi:hypothetical protein